MNEICLYLAIGGAVSVALAMFLGWLNFSLISWRDNDAAGTYIGLVLAGLVVVGSAFLANEVVDWLTPEPPVVVVPEVEDPSVIDKLIDLIPEPKEQILFETKPFGDLVYPQAQRPDFLVKVASSGSQGSDIGSGALISPTLILTCGHNVEDHNSKRELFVIFNDASWSMAKIKHYDRADDIAILELPKAVLTPSAKIRVKPLEIGEKVVIHGYAQSLRYGRSDGVVDAWDQKGGHRGFRVTSPSVQGISGGPVVDANGSIVGLLWASDLKTVSYCVGQEAIWQFLKKSGEDI
jgi:S1-C subfamily serine protease